MSQEIQSTQSFIDRWKKGDICLHPTDTIPGLSFYPRNSKSYEKLLQFKERGADKPFLGLVGSLNRALQLWQQLPKGVLEKLDQIWPGPVSIVWKASAQAPKMLVSKEGYIGLRYPKLNADLMWFQDVLTTIEDPLPTTSVNLKGDAPAGTREQAMIVLKNTSVYTPIWNDVGVLDTAASTVIKILNDGRVAILREGAVAREELERCFE